MSMIWYGRGVCVACLSPQPACSPRVTPPAPDQERMLSAGIVETKGMHSNRSSNNNSSSSGRSKARGSAATQTLARLQQALVGSLVGTPKFQQVLAQREALYSSIDALVTKERAPSSRSLLQPRVKLAQHSLSKQVGLSAAVALATSVVGEALGEGGDAELATEIVQEVASLVAKVKPGELFTDWSPRRVDAGVVLPESAEVRRGSDQREDASQTLGSRPGGWRTKSYASTSMIYIDLKQPVQVSSVRIEWMDGQAAKTVVVKMEVLKEGTTTGTGVYKTVGSLETRSPATSLVPVSGPAVVAIKIYFSGYYRTNSAKRVAVKSITLLQQQPAARQAMSCTPLTTAMHRMQDVLVTIAGQPNAAAATAATDTAGSNATRAEAMRVALRLAFATGSCTALLRLAQHVLASPDAPLAELVDSAQEAQRAEAVKDVTMSMALLLPTLEGKRAQEAREQLVQAATRATNEWTGALEELAKAVQEASRRCPRAIASRRAAAVGGVCATALQWSASRSHKSLQLSNDNKTVMNPSGGRSNALACTNQSFSSGHLTVTWRLDMEAGTCFGFCDRAALSADGVVPYTHRECMLYRSYSGELYGTTRTATKVKQCRVNSIIKMQVDFQRRTVRLFVNDQDCGITHRDWHQRELWPCVQFYETQHKVTIIDCQVGASSGSSKASAKAGAASTTRGGKAAAVALSGELGGSHSDDEDLGDPAADKEPTAEELEAKHPGIMVRGSVRP